jgi:succinate dehydrogenase/fumarate reductase flavoprotein subunit
MEIGVDFWHMANVAGPDFNLHVPEFESAFAYTLDAIRHGLVLVAADGTRYVDETETRRHGKIPFHGIFIHDFMPLPIHAIFDEKARLRGPLYTMYHRGWNFMVEGYKWSKDNSEELAKSWIVKADTIRDLAVKIKKNPDTLEKTLNRYNGFCTAGVDSDFGRTKKYLLALETPPFYAVELVPSFTNTQGGPRRNKFAQILDTEGKPIPRLYSAGEFGSLYSHCYQGGGNVGECIAFGRIAAENAVALKPWK